MGGGEIKASGASPLQVPPPVTSRTSTGLAGQDAAMTPGPSATDQRLRQTIAERMRMSPIDQPLML